MPQTRVLNSFAFRKAPLLASARASQGNRALYTTINARTITNIESPSSNQNGFVLNDILLPILAPIIDPTSTSTAGSQLILPRFQYTIIAGRAVKIVATNDVATAL